MRDAPARAFCLAVALSSAVAAPSVARADDPRPLERTSPAALGIESGATLATFVTLTLASGDYPTECRWCEPTAFDASVRGALRSSHPIAAARASHALSFVGSPLLALGGVIGSAAAAGHVAYGLEDAWVVANSFVLTSTFALATKKVVARQRPGFAYGVGDETEYASTPREQNLSFFSGDTAWAWNLGATATTLAYLRGYAAAPYLAAGGATLGVGTALLRIAADVHYATDVMVGAAVGTGVGVALPLLLHPRKDAPATSVFTPIYLQGGAGVAWAGVF